MNDQTRAAQAPPLAARDYQAVVTNPGDGTRLAITVMQPELAEDEHAPLILHGHGFGGGRLTGRDERTFYEQLSGGILPSTEAARRAAGSGYFVISFDQRGFGDSDGHVHIMDPTYEGRDIVAVLDWAEQEMEHRERLLQRDGRIVVGALGLSYGGGFQLIGACLDARFAAIVPTATWNDLRYSLAPDNVVKTIWGAALVALGLPTSGIRLDPVMYHALLQGLASPLTGRGVSDAVARRLYDHSPASFFDGANEGVDGDTPRRSPTVDALLIQGAGDTLFNLNEALANLRGLAHDGNDVHLIVMRHGHSLPFLEDSDRIGYQTDAELIWNGERCETAAVELAYLDWKLKYREPATPLPRVLVILDDDTHVALDELPVADSLDYDFDGQAATGGLDLLKAVLREDTLGGLWHLVSHTADNAAALIGRAFSGKAGDDDTALAARLVNALPGHQIDELASGGTFLALTTIDNNHTAIVGIPTIEIAVSGRAPWPIAFIGIGVQRDTMHTTELLNDQIRPVRSHGKRRIELNGVAARLSRGDRLGLVIYGFHPQFLASFSAIPGHIQVTGRIGLPLIDLEGNDSAQQ